MRCNAPLFEPSVTMNVLVINCIFNHVLYMFNYEDFLEIFFVKSEKAHILLRLSSNSAFLYSQTISSDANFPRKSSLNVKQDGILR